jgi:hypothetical protein
MGIVALPTYESKEVEKRYPTPRQDYSGMARMGQAQAQTFNILVDAATGIGKSVIGKARADEYNALVSKYNAWVTERLTETELNPINPQDPRYKELESDDEKALPNLSLFAKDRASFIEGLTKDLTFPKVKEAFEQWANDRWVSEQDGLTRFDVAKIREVTFDNYQEEEMAAIASGNFKHAQELADVALAADIITPKMYDDHLDLAAKDIQKSKATTAAFAMGTEGLTWISNADNVKYETYDGKIKEMPANEHESMIRQLKVMIDEKATEQDTLFSDLYVQADTPEKLDDLRTKLIENKYMRGTQKHTWDVWIRDKRNRIVEEGPETAGADVVSSIYSRLYNAVDNNRNPGLEVPISEIDAKVTDPQQHQALLAKRNELQKSHESGGTSTNESTFYEAYRIANDPTMSETAKNKWIDDHTKLGGGLSPDDGMKVRGWIKPYNDNPDRKRAMDSIQQAYTISMQNETDKKRQMAIALDLYNAQNALDKMFNDPKTTKATIDAAVNQFLEGKVVQDIMSVLSQKTGGAGYPGASKFAGTARELETAREQGLFVQFPESGAEFETTYRAEAMKQEQAELKRVGVVPISKTENSLGDMVYTTGDGKEYVVRQTREVDAKGKATMLERVYLVEYRTVNGKTQMRYVKVQK